MEPNLYSFASVHTVGGGHIALNIGSPCQSSRLLRLLETRKIAGMFFPPVVDLRILIK
uniref:Pre-mRNA-splicing factor ATP-dependent RNA helicase PRP16 n=1 Tax=Parascaris univalens TaxID=6257 RepID=A0A915C283_PARUN